MTEAKRRPRRVARVQEWRPEIPPENTAPPEAPIRPDPSEWGLTADEARALLQRQMCPACGEGPWKSPLNHAAKAHGILKRELREACGMNSVESVVDPELRERFAEHGRGRGQDMQALASRPRKKYDVTEAGRATQTANLADVTDGQRRENLRMAKTPEAQAKRSATLRAKWAEISDEERAEWGARVGGDGAHMDRMRQARQLRPCGTRAAYRRGCRCDECRAAYLAYREEHG